MEHNAAVSEEGPKPKKLRSRTRREHREYYENNRRNRDNISAKEEGEEREENEGEKKERLPKRKVALLIGYCGTGYLGLQM